MVSDVEVGFLFSEDDGTDVDSVDEVSCVVVASSCAEGLFLSPTLKSLPDTPSTVRRTVATPTILHCTGDEV